MAGEDGEILVLKIRQEIVILRLDMTELTYIWHDCFVVRTHGAVLIFDYWRDASTAGAKPVDESPRFLDDIEADTPVYVFVSHRHKDHFNKAIFRWGERFRDIHFIISHDTAKFIRYMLRPEGTYAGYKPNPSMVTEMKPGNVYKDRLLRVDAFNSTDTGNSYLVTIGGKRLFHAGDLNVWVWKDEATRAQIAAAMRDYCSILDDIQRVTKGESIDLVMFPVDSRLGRDYWEGAAVFMYRIPVRVFVPMHFCLAETPELAEQRLDDACRFADYAPEGAFCVALQRPYSSLMF